MTHTFALQTRHLLIPLLLCFFGLQLSVARADDKDNTIYNDLLQKGVPLSNGQAEKLPQPAMADGLDAAAQRKVITALVPANRLPSFLAGGLNDWHELKISAIPGNGPNAATGRRIDLYFIANGALATVANKNFMKQQIGQGNKEAFLSEAELKDRKIELAANSNVKERYAHVNFDLFNMVQISATGRGMQTSGKDSELVAFILDPRFTEDADFPNWWKSIKLNPANGRKEFGPPQPYEGAGGYAKVTELLGPNQQVFIEYHLVFDEPNGWFNGKPVLTAKLPDKFRSDVRSFRRDLKAFPGAAAAAQPAAPADQPTKTAPPAGNQPAKTATTPGANNSPVSAAAQPETKKK